ncbi:MAG: hypothetical protein HS111_19055 [Kofleriaceae bacterium]|nr:hypothetical protein [Kofleriaceae bacterium]MCL4228017.1 hypothetical protein [Myxococcales bacterium]
MLDATSARWLMILHGVVAAAAVAATTHWCVWLAPFARGRYRRVPAVKRFGVIAMALYVVTMALGLYIYPTYKARVKLEYLTSSQVVLDDAAARLRSAEQVAARAADREPRALDPGAITRATRDEPIRTEKVARWFDVKEHWVAVGLLLGLATMAVLLAWEPRRDGRGPLVFVGLGAVATCAVTWLAAIIGMLTTATRSL